MLEDRAMLSITTAFDSASGTLTINGGNDGNDIALTTAVSAGNTYVKVNGNDVGSGVLASNVASINFSDGSGYDLVDLCAVHPPDFTALTSVSLAGAGGDRSIFGSDLVGMVDVAGADYVVLNLDFPTDVSPPESGQLVAAEVGDVGVANVGAVTTQGDSILRSDLVRSTYAAFGYNGSGVKIAVISTGVDHWSNVVSTGDLPSTVTINSSLPGSGRGDEGTAMLEIVHDVAPGASLYFSSGVAGSTDMVSSINWMVSQGVKVIVDDLTFFSQPYFQDGSVATAAASAVSSGVSYITSAGNYAQAHYQAGFVSGGTSTQYGQMQAFASGVTRLPIVFPGGGQTTTIFLQWSDPFGGSANDYNLYLVDQSNNLIAQSITVQNGTQNPTESFGITNNGASSAVAYVVIGKASSAATRTLELFTVGGTIQQYVVPTDSLIGQEAVTSVLSTAAANYSTYSTVADYSSKGGSTVFTNFSTQTFTVRNTLFGTAIDGVSTEVGQLGYFVNPFYGTSAAAPHVAGIVALLLNVNPMLSPSQIGSILAATAADIGATGYDAAAGWGRLDAYSAAIAATPLPGDYNNNGVVDSADYAVWRIHLGQSVLLHNDVTPGTVVQGDYDVWRSNFGKTITNGTAADIAIVPGDYNQDGTVDDADLLVWQDNFGSTTNLDADGNFDGVVNTADLTVWREMRGVTTTLITPGDFNGDGIVDMADHALWEVHDPRADVNGDDVVDEDDLAIWAGHWGLTNARFYQATLVGDPPLRIANAAPRVTGIALSGSTSTHDPYSFGSVVGSGEQLRTVPIGGMDTVEITFNEEVYVTQDALTLYGLNNNSVPDLLSFSYDVGTQTAKWQFDGSLPADHYLIRLSDSVYDLDHDALDGEFTNPWSLAETSGNASTFPSGDGKAGGEFRFRFTILPGDFNGSNVVDAADYTVWAHYNSTTSGATQRHGDADGDGDVDTSDFAQWYATYNTDFTRWPSIEPGMILVSTATDESDANYSYGDLSLREALSIAASHSGPDTIVFDPSITEIDLTVGELFVNSDVTIDGPGVSNLTIDGQGNYRVFYVDSGVDAAISGLTITGGVSANDGAGIYSTGNLTLDRVLVTGNAADRNGGGIYADDGNLTVNASTISSNTAVWDGGGVFIGGSEHATTYATTIDSNNAYYGSGIFAGLGAGNQLRIESSTISNNDGIGTYSAGGGIMAQAATSSSTCAATIVNSTISKNSAKYGGGIRGDWNGPHFDIVNSTIAYNRSDYVGGIELAFGSTATLHNTIVAENTNLAGTSDSDVWETLDSASSYNLLGRGGSGGLSDGTNHNIVLSTGQSAGLASLDNYGGLTQTHALLSGSDAIDAGDAATAAAFGLFSDQRGSDRVADGDGNLVLAIDIGAFELAADEYFGEV